VPGAQFTLFAMATIPTAEQPRERLVTRGVASLTDAELVAVVLGTGAPGAPSLDVAHALIERFGGLAGLVKVTPASLAAMRGVGCARAARLAAGAEIARRALAADLARGDAMTSPDAVRAYLRLALAPESVEVFVGLFLDSQHRLIAADELARGTLAQTSVYPREVVKTALARNAAAVIFAHNHPSGVAEPSRADEILTQSLKSALALVDVRTLDHLVVAGARVTSFAERGLL
jgi:DNA repair protein RadC